MINIILFNRKLRMSWIQQSGDVIEKVSSLISSKKEKPIA